MAIADSWRKAGGPEQAATILAEAFNDALKIKDALEQWCVLKLIMKVNAVWREFEDALKTAKRIEGGGTQSNALRIIAEEYAQVGDVPNAIRTTEKIEQGEERVQALIKIGKCSS